MNSSSSRLTFMAVTGMVAVVSMILQAATAPAWWTARGVISTNNVVTNDFAAVNQGQLKWMASNACEELEATLPGGAGSNVWARIAEFSITNNFRPVNLGQLKYVVQPFYERLMDVGYTADYPWNDSTNAPTDYALANIGQMKNVFSFDVATWLGLDSDNDGMTNAWELANGLNPRFNDANDISSNPWAHGLSNLQLYQNPSLLLADNYSTLDDGIPDWWKIVYGFSVTTPASTVAPNGLTLEENYQSGTNPNAVRVSLVGEIAPLVKEKCGFDTYQPTNPPKMYLKEVISWSDLIGGNPESGPLDIGPGTSTTEYDPLTGEPTESGTGIGSPLCSPVAISPTLCIGTNTYVRPYDDPPNQVYDEPGSQIVTATLSVEYTTAMLKQYTAEQCPAFADVFSDENLWAEWNLSEDEKTCTLQKLQYRFQFQPSATNITLNWVEVFTPNDNPTNKVYTPKTWTGSGTNTSVFTIDPYQRDPNKYGTYTVLLVQIDFATKRYIPATTSWPDATAALTNASTLDIAVRTTPSGSEGSITLEIDHVSPDAPPTTNGELTCDTNNLAIWHYRAFAEAKTEKHPIAKQVYFKATLNGTTCVTEFINVSPVFQHLAFSMQPSIYPRDRENAWRYAKWKYDINTDALSSIRYDGSLEVDGFTRCSGSNKRTCRLSLGAYSTENWCASVLGHENVHGGQPYSYFEWWFITYHWIYPYGPKDYYKLRELPAYQWQIDTASQTGLNSNEVSGVQLQIERINNGQAPE